MISYNHLTMTDLTISESLPENICEICKNPPGYQRELLVKCVPRHKDVLKGFKKEMTTLTINICPDCERLYLQAGSPAGGWDSWDQLDSIDMIIQSQRFLEMHICFECGPPHNLHLVRNCCTCLRRVCVFHAHSTEKWFWKCSHCGEKEPLVTSQQLWFSPKTLKRYLDSHPKLL